jgi:hypothetical protein
MPRLIASIADGDRAEAGIGLLSDPGGEKTLGVGPFDVEQPANISRSEDSQMAR